MLRTRQAAETATRTVRDTLRRVLLWPLTEELGRLALLVVAVVSLTDAGEWVFKLDSYVYYAAVEQWHDGGDLYRWYALPSQNLWPFTYTPLAAWLLTPLTWLTYEWATALLVAATPVCTAVAAWAVLRAVWGQGGPVAADQPPQPRTPGSTSPPGFQAPSPRLSAQELRSLAPWLGLAAVTVLEPFPKTMEYGQVNTILMVLVVLDVLTVPEQSPWRGVLSGLAAAVKLTPAIAVLIFLTGRQWRAATTMVGCAVGLTLLAGLASPRPSWEFFTWAMWDTQRAGFTDYSGNQNLMGAISRSLPEHLRSPTWILCVALVLLATCLLSRRLDTLAPAGAPSAAAPSGRGLVLALQMSVVMVAGLLISPISWSHHWVWALPALMALGSAACRWRSPALAGVTTAGVLVFLLAVHWYFPEQNHVEQYWSTGQKLLGSSYTWWALGSGAVLWAVSGRLARHHASQVEPAPLALHPPEPARCSSHLARGRPTCHE